MDFDNSGRNHFSLLIEFVSKIPVESKQVHGRTNEEKERGVAENTNLVLFLEVNCFTNQTGTTKREFGKQLKTEQKLLSV